MLRHFHDQTRAPWFFCEILALYKLLLTYWLTSIYYLVIRSYFIFSSSQKIFYLSLPVTKHYKPNESMLALQFNLRTQLQ